jgi:hypothetical protein
MSSQQAKELAQKFIEEQKRILNKHGDTSVRTKEAVTSAQKTFQNLSTAAKAIK